MTDGSPTINPHMFRAYDIRGLAEPFGADLTPDVARLIGQAWATWLMCRRGSSMVVGGDMRPHTPALRGAFIDGALAAGSDVIVSRRNADVIAAFRRETRPESWVSDLWRPQIQVDAATHQLCLAHQIRNLSYAAEADGYVGLVWAVELRLLAIAGPSPLRAAGLPS